MLAAASLNEDRAVLAGKVETVELAAATHDLARLPDTVAKVPVRLRVPPKTRTVRVVVQTAENDRIGAVEIDSKTLNSAPQAPTPEKLISRPRNNECPLSPRGLVRMPWQNRCYGPQGVR